MENPSEFLNQYRVAREGAALFDVSDRGKIEIRGKDAATFLHNLCTNDVKGLAIGSGCEAFLTTGQAKIVSFCVIERIDSEAFWLDLAPGNAAKVTSHLEHFHVTEDLEITDRTGEISQFHVAGPRSTSVIANAAGAEIRGLDDLQHAATSIHDVPCRVRRHDPLGLLGYDILFLADAMLKVPEAFNAAGAATAGADVYRVLRIEAGTPEYGIDIDETNLPQEVGRMKQAVSFTKGCYIGQETVARIRTYGHVNRALVGLRLTGNGDVLSKSIIRRDGAEVGHVTSAAISPLVGTAIALGYVRRGSNEPGTVIEIVTGGESLGGEICGLPFVAQPST